MTKDNIILIGMPASGKSTVGVILAKVLGKDFVDSDIVIQQREGARLSELIEKYGVDDFMIREEKAILGMYRIPLWQLVEARFIVIRQ